MTGICSHGAVSTGVRVKPELDKCSHFVAAIDYGIFGDKNEFENNLSAYLQELRDSQKADGQTRIYTHGEKEAEKEKEVLEGGVGINEATLKEIHEYCAPLGIDADRYLVRVR